MGLRSYIRGRLLQHICSAKYRNSVRAKAERKRRAANSPHIVEYFHEAGDPYSHLMAQLLPEFCERYEVELKIHIVPPAPDWAAPDRARLDAYSRLDCDRLAGRQGWDFTDPEAQPSADRIRTASALFLDAVERGTFLDRAAQIGTALWDGAPLEDANTDGVDAALQAADAHRNQLRHYLSATLFYAGEWYWGPDRLHYLEERLSELGAARENKPEGLIFKPLDPPTRPSPTSTSTPLELHWYLSFRSPYTAIVADRVKALADAYGAELKLRIVLPMVMRGMKVPPKKGFYIIKDVAREAERLDIPFGKICDPVGRPVENGYAILTRAIAQGQGFEFVQSFLSGVWAEGLDAGTDKGMKQIAERAGLNWAEMRQLLGDQSWRETADVNEQEMFSYGSWGVPSFRVGDTIAWGQDRLWVIEQALADHVQSQET